MQADALERERTLQRQLSAQQNAGACVADEFADAADELRRELERLRGELALATSERDRTLIDATDARAAHLRSEALRTQSEALFAERELAHRSDLAKLQATIASEQGRLATATSALNAAEKRLVDATAERDTVAAEAKENALARSLAQDSMVILQSKVAGLAAQLEGREGVWASADRSVGRLSEQAAKLACENEALSERIRTLEDERAELMEHYRTGEFQSLHFFQLIVALYERAGELLRSQAGGDVQVLVDFRGGMEGVQANVGSMLDEVLRALHALVKLARNLKGLSSNLLQTVQLCSKAPNLDGTPSRHSM
jgi:chromosome segregation ATPase